jgi:hypothetical protein
MLEFYAENFVTALTRFGAFEIKLAGEAKSQLKPAVLRQLCREVTAFGVDCGIHQLKSSALQCDRILGIIENSGGVVLCGRMRDELRNLRTRFEDDLKAEAFFHLSLEEKRLFYVPEEHWEAVIWRFPKVQIDIDECSKCFALGRYAASLFHALLVAEYGVIALAKLLGVAGDKPGWGSLERLERIAAKPYKERSNLEQENSKLLDEIMPFAFSMKNQWRHKIYHVENKLVWVDTDFSPQMARDIIGAVRGFMDKLATAIPKPLPDGG